MSFENYVKETLQGLIDPDVYATLVGCRAMLGGGAITSLATKSEINDLDIYFKDLEGLVKFLCAMDYAQDESLILSDSDLGDKLIYTFSTNKSVLFTNRDGLKVQAIVYRVFGSPQVIMESFDFTACMAVFDFATHTLHLHDDFLLHNSQRYLKFNTGTEFPLVSAFRVDKYRERGYTISKSEFMRIMITISGMNISSWEEAEEHIGGMYGLAIHELFDKTRPFSIQEAVSQLSCVGSVYHDHAQRPSDAVYDFKFISGLVEKNFGKKFIRTEDQVQDGILWKWVRDDLTSYYDKNFQYVVGKEVKIDGTCGVFGYHTIGELLRGTNSSHQDRVALKILYRDQPEKYTTGKYHVKDFTALETYTPLQITDMCGIRIV